MPKCCSIPGCHSTIRDNFMFSIVENTNLAKWWKATPWYDKVNDDSISKDLMICDVHFRNDQICKTISDVRLMSNVVPTINLPESLSITRVDDNSTQQTDCNNLLLIYCRFCGQKQKDPIKNHLEDLIESEDLIQLCLGRGRFLEGFPNGVCYNCYQIIEATTCFIRHCEQAQEKLQKIFFDTPQQVGHTSQETESDTLPENQLEMPEAVISPREEQFVECNIELGFCKVESLNEDHYDEMKNNVTDEAPRAGEIRCTICDRTFNRKRALNAHMESFHEKKIFACTICGKTMGWRKTLQRHMKSHEENFQKHKCKLCDRAFSRPSHLRLHMNKHTGKKLRCPMCLNGFRDKYKLGIHLMKTYNMDNDTAKAHAQNAVSW